MKQRKYWKDVWYSFTTSWVRTLSIVFMIILGTMTFIGLSVAGPNMERTAQSYINRTNMFDLAVISDYGLSNSDIKELKSIKDVTIEFGYMEDITILGTTDSIRVMSDTDSISKNIIDSGKIPTSENQIALSYTLKNKYQLGDKIKIEKGSNSILQNTEFTVVGFVKSPEIWSSTMLGKSSVGTGELSGYAVVPRKTFSSQFYSIARLTYKDLRNISYNSSIYDKRLKKHENELNNLLKDNSEAFKNDFHLRTSPQYMVYNRSTLPGGDGYLTYKSSTSSISSLGTIFSGVLYLVTALITLTTITRFVDEERIKAGVFQSLGYTKVKVINKFIIYSLATSLLGTIVGILLGNYKLSPMIGKIVTDGMVVGTPNSNFYWLYTLVSLSLSLIVAVFPTYLVAKRELNTVPSQLLLPKPPSDGSEILLEKLSFIWRKLSFTYKIAARNISRYKVRTFMTIFGVAGSVALFFTGLGIQASIQGVSDTQFGEIVKHDLIIYENSSSNSQDYEELSNYLNKKAISRQSIEIQNLNTKISKVDNRQSITLFIVPNKNSLENYISLRSRQNNKKIELSDKGVILSEKLADLYNVKKGDYFNLQLNGKKVKVRVDGISEMYAGHFIYLTKDYYESIQNGDYHSNSLLVKLKKNEGQSIEKASFDLLKLPSVQGISQNTSLINMLEKFSSSMQSVTYILIVIAIILMIVVLYNLTTINILERVRELSTIKVLGFFSKEVTMYIYRETISLSIIGIIIGLIGGKILHSTLIKMIVRDEIMLNPNVGIVVYLIPILSVGVILLLLGLMINHKLKNINMLDALKSVD